MRRTVWTAAAMVLGSLALVAGASSPAMACSPAFGTPTEQELLARADVVFEGVVLGSRDPSAGAPMSSLDPILYTFAADRVVKGSITAQPVVATPRSGASCGTTFAVGARYRVYARIEGGILTTLSVSGNRQVPLVTTTTTAPGTTAPPASPRSGPVRLTG